MSAFLGMRKYHRAPWCTQPEMQRRDADDITQYNHKQNKGVSQGDSDIRKFKRICIAHLRRRGTSLSELLQLSCLLVILPRQTHTVSHHGERKFVCEGAFTAPLRFYDGFVLLWWCVVASSEEWRINNKMISCGCWDPCSISLKQFGITSWITRPRAQVKKWLTQNTVKTN